MRHHQGPWPLRFRPDESNTLLHRANQVVLLVREHHSEQSHSHCRDINENPTNHQLENHIDFFRLWLRAVTGAIDAIIDGFCWWTGRSNGLGGAVVLRRYAQRHDEISALLCNLPGDMPM